MNADTEKDYRAIRIFRGLDESSLGRIASVSYLQTFPPEVTLVAQGQTSDFVHGVVSGHVELSSQEGDQSATLLVIEAGDIVPPSGLLMAGPTAYAARTLARSRIVMTPVSAVRSLMDAIPGFTVDLLRQSDSTNRQLLRELHNRNLRRPHQRIALWIHEHVTAGDEQVELPYSKRMLASILGMSMATLSRDIETLEAHGISFEGKHIRVRDPGALAALAHPSPQAEI